MDEIIDLIDTVSPDHLDRDKGAPPCDIVLHILGRKWVIPILSELAIEPRRRKYLFAKLRVPSSRLDPTIQELARWGLIERLLIPCGKTDGVAVAITDLGRSFLALASRLSEWQSTHQSELRANDVEWRTSHADSPH